MALSASLGRILHGRYISRQVPDRRIPKSNRTQYMPKSGRQAIAGFSQVAAVSYRKEARRCTCHNSHLTSAAPPDSTCTSIARDHRQNISSVSPRWYALKCGFSRSGNPLQRAFLPLNSIPSQSTLSGALGLLSTRLSGCQLGSHIPSRRGLWWHLHQFSHSRI